jgi:hypothetical protein
MAAAKVKATSNLGGVESASARVHAGRRFKKRMVYPEPESGDEGDTLTIPDFEFSGEPGDIISLKFLGDGKFQRVMTEEADDEPPEDEDLKTTLRRDMAAIPPEGEM